MSGERFEFDGTLDHRGGQQFVNGRGVYGSGFTRIHRLETAGFASMPIKGAQGLLLAPNGHPDQAFLLGGEHYDHRPVLVTGGTAIYDHTGQIVKLVGTHMELTSGGVTAKISPAGVDFIGGYVRHNGKNIGDTHHHLNVVNGPDETGNPV